jgi:tetratricopeptide (TPR) repeat protein
MDRQGIQAFPVALLALRDNACAGYQAVGIQGCRVQEEGLCMYTRVLLLLCSLVLLVPLSVGADAGGGNGGDSANNPWNRQADPKQATADYEAGYRQLKAGDYKGAIKAFKRVINANPNHAMAYTNMAYSYRKLGDYKQAVKLYDKALALEPNLPEAHE